MITPPTTRPSNVQFWNFDTIASWQLNVKSRASTEVDMPDLQRGYVWAAHQVEGLWDSLVRQLPIGAFLVTPYRERLVSQRDAAGAHAGKPKFLLLDGQQRATSIALAYADPWKDCTSSYTMALWVDLAKPGSTYHDRAYMFRLVTHSHPWGYQRNAQGRLESNRRKDALDAFVNAIKLHKRLNKDAPLPKEAQYPGLSAVHSWPWDAFTPLPFALLWEAIGRVDWQDCLLSKLEAIPFWQSPMPTQYTSCWKEKICKLLEDKNSEEYDRLCILANALLEVQRSTLIPGIIVPEKDIAQQLWELAPPRQEEGEAEQTNEAQAPDAVESLFIRINSAGTPIQGEELIYSTFKAILPESKKLVEMIGADTFIRPATLVALVGRLVLNIEQDKMEELRKQPGITPDETSERQRSGFPPALNVTRFRSLVHASDGVYKTALKKFMHDKAKKLFSNAREFLAGTPDQNNQIPFSNKNDYRLGSLLTENLARSAPDVYFFFLRWLYDNLDKQQSDAVHKRILGALTGIAFFAPNPTAFVRRLWKRRSGAWWQRNFLCTENSMRMKDDKLVMLPLPSPKELSMSLHEKMPLKRKNSPTWKEWNWYNTLTSKYPKRTSVYARHCRKLLGSQHAQEDSRHVDMAWAALWEKLWNERRLVIYAQRHWLDAFFPGYNPAAPDQLEDSDRPFDWDHIFPNSYFYRKRGILNLWRYDWPQTIGNLRAWPMELNRGDGKILPHEKLSKTTDKELDARWKALLTDNRAIRDASFIDEKNWKKWKKCCGSDRDITNALKQKSDLGTQLLSAITERLCSIYRHWYESLDVGSTFGLD